MFFFKKVNFSENMYEISRNDDLFYVSVDCVTNSTIYQKENNKRYMDIQFEDNNQLVHIIKELENVIETEFECNLANKLTKDNVLTGCKIPFKYNRMDIPLVSDNYMTSSEIKKGITCKIDLLGKYFYKWHMNSSGILWTIKKIVII